MEILGYCSFGSRDAVVFEEHGQKKVSDGFHDWKVTDENRKRMTERKESEINIEKLVSRFRGARPWHPILKELRKVKKGGN